MDVRLYRVSARDSNGSGTIYQSRSFKTALTVLKRVRRAAKQHENDNAHYTMEYIDNGIVKGELACYE